MSTPNRPVHEIRLSGFRASIWLNQKKQGRSCYSVTVSRVYREAEEWRNVGSVRRDDIPLVSKAAELAYAWIWKERDSKRETVHVGSQ